MKVPLGLCCSMAVLFKHPYPICMQMLTCLNQAFASYKKYTLGTTNLLAPMPIRTNSREQINFCRCSANWHLISSHLGLRASIWRYFCNLILCRVLIFFLLLVCTKNQLYAVFPNLNFFLGSTAGIPRGRKATRKLKHCEGIDFSDHWSRHEKFDGDIFLESAYRKHLSRHANKCVNVT